LDLKLFNGALRCVEVRFGDPGSYLLSDCGVDGRALVLEPFDGHQNAEAIRVDAVFEAKRSGHEGFLLCLKNTDALQALQVVFACLLVQRDLDSAGTDLPHTTETKGRLVLAVPRK
jgi:hypothetical protein